MSSRGERGWRRNAQLYPRAATGAAISRGDCLPDLPETGYDPLGKPRRGSLAPGSACASAGPCAWPGTVMIVLIDNYDSFTYNLVQRLGEIDPGVDLVVVRNDQVSLDEIEAMRPTRLIISPGPCTPLEAGISNA